MIVKLMYFKSDGIYAREESYQSAHSNMANVFSEVRKMIDNNTLPGITNKWDGFILVDSETGYPRLLDVN